MKVKVLPKTRLTEKGFVAYAEPNGYRDNQRKNRQFAETLTDEEIRSIRSANRDSKGRYVKGNNGPLARGKAKGIRQQIKELQQVCLDTLLEDNAQGVQRVQDAIRRLSANKPEHLVQFVSKLLPKEQILTQKKKAAPIVIEKMQLNQINSDSASSSTPSPSSIAHEGSINGKIVSRTVLSPTTSQDDEL